MKIISFNSGTVLSLFQLEAFTPLGWMNEREIIAAIGQRYSFGTIPTMSTYEELEQGLVFELGFFATQEGEFTIHRLAIFNDGIVIRTSKTEYSEAILENLANWLISDYGFRKLTPQSLYLSEVVVEFEKPAVNMFAKYDRIIDIIFSNMTAHKEASAAAFNSLSIEFVSKSQSIAKFMIERRVGTSVNDECYFCSAPLTTEGHLRALEEIEHLFS